MNASLDIIAINQDGNGLGYRNIFRMSNYFCCFFHKFLKMGYLKDDYTAYFFCRGLDYSVVIMIYDIRMGL